MLILSIDSVCRLQLAELVVAVGPTRIMACQYRLGGARALLQCQPWQRVRMCAPKQGFHYACNLGDLGSLVFGPISSHKRPDAYGLVCAFQE